MELNKAAAIAAQLSFDKAWSEFDGQPTVLQRIGALNAALEAYESVRVASELTSRAQRTGKPS